jgi:hypothetical protein
MSPDQNMSLFDDPVLFRAWGTDWYVTKFCLATGVGLLLLAGLFGWILASHTKGAKWEALSSREAADLAVNAGRAPHERVGQVYAGKAVGVSGEISFGIDDLRQAARGGDWLTFWLFPIVFSCGFGGMWFFFSGLTLSLPRAIWIFLTLFCATAVGVVWFMAWAAIYTNIDAGTARKSSGQEQTPGR